MTNFNEKINSHKKFFLFDNEYNYFLARIGSMRQLKLTFGYYLKVLKTGYRLFIKYKDTHRVKKVAGRCFLWDNTDGSFMKDPGNSIELRSINDARQDDCEGFGNPRFDSVDAAILISERFVCMYGDVQIEVDDITQDKKYVVCTVSLCDSIVSCFRIPAEVFDRLFGLKENFPEQDEKQVEEKKDPIEEVKRSIELLKDSLWSNKRMIERAVDLIKCASIDIEDMEFELDDMLYKLT